MTELKPKWGCDADLPREEEYTEYRLTWTYPYLENQGRCIYSYGRSENDAIGNAQRNDGFNWAGKRLGWHKRTVRIERGEWESA
jgi:hypothetical protein